MNDRKLAMFREIERIKQQEKAKIDFNFGFDLDRKILQLEEQLNLLNNNQFLIIDHLKNLGQDKSVIKEKLNKNKRMNEKKQQLDAINTKIAQLNDQLNKIKLKIEFLSKQKNEIYKYKLANQSATQPTTDDQKISNLNDNQRYLLEISTELFLNKISIGDAIKKLRVNILKVNQEQFGKLVKVSRKTISEIENNRGNLSADKINSIVKPFNLRLTLLPTSNELLDALKKSAN